MVETRVQAHNKGRGATYTKTRRPVTLVYMQEFDDRRTALAAEYRIKQLSRVDKTDLIVHWLTT